MNIKPEANTLISKSASTQSNALPAEERSTHSPKPRCGKILMKYDSVRKFTCHICGKEKSSRKIAILQYDLSVEICNACYGEIIAKTEQTKC